MHKCKFTNAHILLRSCSLDYRLQAVLLPDVSSAIAVIFFSESTFHQYWHFLVFFYNFDKVCQQIVTFTRRKILIYSCLCPTVWAGSKVVKHIFQNRFVSARLMAAGHLTPKFCSVTKEVTWSRFYDRHNSWTYALLLHNKRFYTYDYWT